MKTFNLNLEYLMNIEIIVFFLENNLGKISWSYLVQQKSISYKALFWSASGFGSYKYLYAVSVRCADRYLRN